MAVITSCYQMIGYSSLAPLPTRNRMAGMVSVDGQPAKRFVAIFNRMDFTWIATVISDPYTGKWEISGLPEYPERTLIAVAFDTIGNYNAEVADYLSQMADG